jgi:hypothetical protein
MNTLRGSLQRRASRCARCGYDLRSLDRDILICPECGSPAAILDTPFILDLLQWTQVRRIAIAVGCQLAIAILVSINVSALAGTLFVVPNPLVRSSLIAVAVINSLLAVYAGLYIAAGTIPRPHRPTAFEWLFHILSHLLALSMSVWLWHTAHTLHQITMSNVITTAIAMCSWMLALTSGVHLTWRIRILLDDKSVRDLGLCAGIASGSVAILVLTWPLGLFCGASVLMVGTAFIVSLVAAVAEFSLLRSLLHLKDLARPV